MAATWKNRTALVTGASSGLGADFARLLAEGGANLVLVARREDRLAALRDELAARHPVRVEVLPADLAGEATRAALPGRVAALGLAVDVLVNNAGLGSAGEFLDAPWGSHASEIRVDVEALVHLTHLFVPPMIERGWGRVLLVGSIGAFQPSPAYATYAACKAFVASFGDAVGFELRRTGVRVTTTHPGPTLTGFFDAAGQDRRTFYQRAAMMESRAVAAGALKALARGRAVHVPGWINGLGVFAMRFLPRRAAARVAWLCIGGIKERTR